MRAPCKIEGCGRPVHGRGLCPKHHLRWLRLGDPLAPSRMKLGAKHWKWRGGRTSTMRGYVALLSPNHPHKNRQGYVYEHRIVAEKALGHLLPRTAEVHHVNENPTDNRNTNLVVCQDHTYHMLIQVRARAHRASGHADWRKCCFCKKYDAPASLTINGSHIHHRDCRNAYRRAQRDKASSEGRVGVQRTLSGRWKQEEAPTGREYQRVQVPPAQYEGTCGDGKPTGLPNS